MCQTAFSVMPSPHIFPTLLTLRNSLPRSMAAAVSQLSSSCLTQSGTGTVRTWPPLPTRSTITRWRCQTGTARPASDLCRLCHTSGGELEQIQFLLK